ncbi:MAG: GCN5 family acetyltransferase [Acidiferrobacteraceae bacterium]|nr:GCN5 family acetyltransferase [Acidiferrobacteraceae bacterium]
MISSDSNGKKSTGMIKIETERLILKKLKRNDMQALILGIGEWEVAKWLSNVPHPYTENDAEDWLGIVAHQELNLNIFEHNALVGGIGLEINDHGCWELGYWLDRQHWQRGYAVEAAKGLLDYAAKELSIEKIEASHMKGNDASARVLKKLGFKAKGIGKVYSVARKEKVPCKTLVLEL